LFGLGDTGATLEAGVEEVAEARVAAVIDVLEEEEGQVGIIMNKVILC